MRQSKNIKSPPEERQEEQAHQLYDKAAKTAFSKETVLGLMVKHSVISPEETGTAETDFLENEFPSVFVSKSCNVSSSLLLSDRIVRIRRKGEPTVFLILEIQSRSDRNMAVRMKHYADALLDRLLDTGPEESSFCIHSLVVNIGLDRWTGTLSLVAFCVKRGREFHPTDSMPDFSYLLESADADSGSKDGRDAYSRLGTRYRELDVYLGMIRRFMEARTIVPGDEKLGRKWWLLFCLMTRQELGVNMNLLRNMAEETDMEEGVTMEEIFHNYRTSLINEGLEKGIEKGIEKGRVEGRAEGRTEGCEEELVRSISKLVRKNFSAHQAMDLLDVPEDKRDFYAAKVKAII